MKTNTYGTTPPDARADGNALWDRPPAAVVLDAYVAAAGGQQRHFTLAGVVLRLPVVFLRRPNGQGMSAKLADAAAFARAAAQSIIGDSDAWFVVVTSPDNVAQHNTASLSAAANKLPLAVSTTQRLHPRAATLHMAKDRAALMPLPLRDMVIEAAVYGADVEEARHAVVWRGGPDA